MEMLTVHFVTHELWEALKKGWENSEDLSLAKCGDFSEGGGFQGLCSNPQKIQSERAEGVDLPEEEGGG